MRKYKVYGVVSTEDSRRRRQLYSLERHLTQSSMQTPLLGGGDALFETQEMIERWTNGRREVGEVCSSGRFFQTEGVKCADAYRAEIIWHILKVAFSPFGFESWESEGRGCEILLVSFRIHLGFCVRQQVEIFQKRIGKSGESTDWGTERNAEKDKWLPTASKVLLNISVSC